MIHSNFNSQELRPMEVDLTVCKLMVGENLLVLLFKFLVISKKLILSISHHIYIRKSE